MELNRILAAALFAALAFSAGAAQAENEDIPLPGDFQPAQPVKPAKAKSQPSASTKHVATTTDAGKPGKHAVAGRKHAKRKATNTHAASKSPRAGKSSRVKHHASKAASKAKQSHKQGKAHAKARHGKVHHAAAPTKAAKPATHKASKPAASKSKKALRHHKRLRKHKAAQ